MQINPNSEAFFSDCISAYYALQDYQNAITDFQESAKIYGQEGNTESHQEILAAIAQLKSEI